MKRTDFTKDELKILRENFMSYIVNEAKGEGQINQQESTWHRLASCSIKSRPDSTDFWNPVAITPGNRVYGCVEDQRTELTYFEWRGLEELEPLNQAARNLETEIRRSFGVED